jgi:hypothetical protein
MKEPHGVTSQKAPFFRLKNVYGCSSFNSGMKDDAYQLYVYIHLNAFYIIPGRN